MFAALVPELEEELVDELEVPVIALESAVDVLPTLEMLLISDLAKSSCRSRRRCRTSSSCC
jgi:hypothetical protein